MLTTCYGTANPVVKASNSCTGHFFRKVRVLEVVRPGGEASSSHCRDTADDGQYIQLINQFISKKCSRLEKGRIGTITAYIDLVGSSMAVPTSSAVPLAQPIFRVPIEPQQCPSVEPTD